MGKRVLLTATVQSHIVQFHRPLAALFHAHGWEVHVAARNNLGEKNGLALDFADRVFDVPFARSPMSRDNLRAAKELKRIINGNGYDVIQCNTPVGGVLTRMCARKARKKGARVIYTSHGFFFYKGAPKKNYLLYYPVEKWLARRDTDLLLTINEEDLALAREKFSCPVGRLHGVGVDPARYTFADEAARADARAALGIPQGVPVILSVGELRPNKNQTMLIEALPAVREALPDVRVLIAGNGPDRERLEALAAARGVGDAVTFLGYTTHLEDYQKAADLSVSCSIREGLGLNLIEAMLTGNPVIATDNRGHRELIRDGVNGYLVSLGDTSSLAARMIDVLSAPAGRRAEMGREGCAMAQDYTFDAVTAELDRFFFPDEARTEADGGSRTNTGPEPKESVPQST